jgi:UDP-glucose 4-epimerase
LDVEVALPKSGSVVSVRVLVTGGAGFIGSNLVRELLDDDHEVVVLDDLSTGDNGNLAGLKIDFLNASILEASSLRDAADGCQAIVHLAARPSVPRSIANPELTHEVNVTGTVRVLEVARALGNPHVILASSSSVYGANRVLPKSETALPLPLSPYAVSKLAAEQYALAWTHTYGLEVLAFRFFNVFGPRQSHLHDYAAVIPSFIDAALRGAPVSIFGDGTQTRDFTYVETVCRVIANSIGRRVVSPSPINLAYGTRISLLQVLDKLEMLVGRGIERKFERPRPSDVRDSQADNGLLRSHFPEIKPVGLDDGLSKTVAWFRETFSYQRW